MESKTRKIIHRGHSILSVEVLSDDSHPVVIKEPANRRSSGRITRSLENEYEMTRSLDAVEGVRKAREQHSIDNQPALILEYIDGQTLRDHAGRSTPNLRSKLEIAVDLARILSKVHQQDVIHLDLNSNNILIGNKKQTVHLIDLGSASRIHGSGRQSVQPDLGLESLPYISPEQTGRINRAVDERSDLYSLGVVLHELMTGQLPFDSKNPIELIHHHIARVPVPPSEISPEIPEVISAIILKLLRKSAEDRYQSAAGLHNDLKKCLERLAPGNVIADFALAEADFSGRVRFPQKLYGREKELRELVDDFDRACQENSVITFVSGFSGIGKTALVEEMRQPVFEKHGYFTRGKFDQVLRTTPYSAITQAFAALVTQILTEPEESFNEWKDTIQLAVGDLGTVLTDVIPALEELIGTQPSVSRLGGQESENRFNLVFINFVTAVATEEHPLVLFIDDLQWIDAASLKLLKVIRSDFNQPGLLVIGAYRDNEVDLTHPLMEFLGNREAKGIRPRILKLDNLTQQSLEGLLSDTLSTQEGIEQLGSAIYERTEGNPFFVRRLLSSLNDEGRIRFDSELMSWTWDIADIESTAIADNVADLLAQRILLLTEEAVNILKLAACIGNRFDISTLATISGHTEQGAIKLLTATSCGHYVLESGDAHEFVHDQVQKAVYTLIDAGARTEKHLEIARLLLAGTAETDLEERVFEIVSQFNLSADLLTDPTEKRRVAELNLLAGRRSKASSAFAAAASYLQQSLELLGEDAWRDHYELSLDVHNELMDACFLNIDYEEVDSLFAAILDHVKDDVDGRIAYKTMILTKLYRNELAESISLADDFLERLRIGFVDAPGSKLSVDEVLDLPPMRDREKLAALEIMLSVTSPTYIAATERLPSLAFTMVDIVNQYGQSNMSGPAYNFYSLILCFSQQYKEANRFSRLSLELLERYPYPGITAMVADIHYAFIRHWESPVHDLIEPLKTSYQVGMQEGDFEWGLWCLLNHTLLIWASGRPLDDYLAEVERSVEAIRSKSQEVNMLMFLLFAQSAANLAGRSEHTTRLEGDWFSEETMGPGMEGNTMLLALHRLQKMTFQPRLPGTG